jgi:hypothetical protein
MNNIELLVTEQSGSGSYHVKLVLDSKESGILYLSKQQLEAVASSFKSYCYENNLSFLLENPFDYSVLDDIEDDDDTE